MMKYIIMADGKGHRWHHYLNRDKAQIEFGGETLLQRTTRLIHEQDSSAEVIITSHNREISVDGAKRYEPLNNVLELDRFTSELIDDNECFLYGDVFYTDEAMGKIISLAGSEPLLFVGNEKSICAVLVKDGRLFADCIAKVRSAFLSGGIGECKGWQVYHCYAGMPLEGKAVGAGYVMLSDVTRDFNSPADYEAFLAEK